MNETIVNNIVRWLQPILYGIAIVPLLLYALVLLVQGLVTRRVRVRSRQGLMTIFCIGLSLATANWIMGEEIYQYVFGGTAYNGKVIGHKYFLGSHGKYVEVSSSFWWFSYWYHVTTYVVEAFFVAAYYIIWLLWGRAKGGQEAYSAFHIIESLKEHDRRHPWGKRRCRI